MLYIPESHWTMDHPISFKSLPWFALRQDLVSLHRTVWMFLNSNLHGRGLIQNHTDSLRFMLFQLDSYLYQSYLYNQLLMYCIVFRLESFVSFCIQISKHWVTILVRSWTRWVPSRFWASARCWTAAAATRRPAAPPSRRPPRWWWRSRRVGFICWTSSPRIQCLGETEPEEWNYILLL